MDIWQEHDQLYHYTTQPGLKGILKSQMLHATHFKYVNDPSEMYHMLPKLKALVTPHCRKAISEMAAANKIIQARIDADGGLERIVEHDISAAVNALYKVTFGSIGRAKFYEPYIVSFCGHKDDYERENGLLSQWRGYGHDAGYALVFETKKLADLVKAEAGFHHVTFGDVIYDGDDDGFKREFADLIKTIDDVFPRVFTKTGPPFDALYSCFISGVSRFKHRGFREEQEVRILFSPANPPAIDSFKKVSPEGFERNKDRLGKEVHFRDQLTPYIRLFDTKPVALPIIKVIVGPHVDKEARQERLQRYAEMRGLNIEVTCSQTPFVEYR